MAVGSKDETSQVAGKRDPSRPLASRSGAAPSPENQPHHYQALPSLWARLIASPPSTSTLTLTLGLVLETITSLSNRLCSSSFGVANTCNPLVLVGVAHETTNTALFPAVIN